MWTAIYKLFLKGLAAVLPIAITVFILWWLGSGFEAVLGGAVRFFLTHTIGERFYVPGMGLLLGIALIFAVGVLLNAWFVRRLWRWFESLLDRVPLVRAVYGSVKQVIDYLSGAATEDAQQVVLVSINDDTRLLGFVTRESLDDIPGGFAQALAPPEGDDQHHDDRPIAVFLPWSYQMGGFTVFIPRSRVTPLDMSVEQGLRFAITAGVSTEPAKRPDDTPEPTTKNGET